MLGVGLVRVRWRLSGAWRWRAFVFLTIIDAVIGHALPPQGETQSVAGAALDGLVLNLLAVLLITRPLSALLRKAKRDLPTVVARDYAATWIVIGVSAALLGAGLVHRSSVQAGQRAMREAIARAQAWIGARAPEPFRAHLTPLSMLELQPGSVYRACVGGGVRSGRSFCVIVNLQAAWARSVRSDGSEPNSLFGRGVG
jgi:hypothetical protein